MSSRIPWAETCAHLAWEGARARRRSGWPRSAACAAAAVAAVWAATGLTAPAAYADAPAVTDFGLDEALPVWAAEAPGADRAAFVTLYPDGRGQWQVHHVRGDAIVGFAAEHPAWQLDPGLMWFVQMPVYVRHVPAPRSPGVESV
ncbi:hypothetical protein [Alicyclobacillus macrosporangiidus]|jgi:hypothetical protein|uniref:Uncharacterized protein n=1 Tax=Alicyclobacillus macrosporangiidus TaxID=392015 RepID=A0A1I7J0V8_9BACL|nr:hypothetical protein [Alicyclobacillus macrosporangiidus]SFU78754.1 hypothetical protein SAMN05421543_10843 [Alicyclobacillus macrosporangiidus]